MKHEKFETPLGHVIRRDCTEFLEGLKPDSVDMVFADPPFNLGKFYSSNINDSLKEDQYLSWCKKWLTSVHRCLKPGGSFFHYNLPKWNLALGAFTSDLLEFRHWIAIEIASSLPIAGRLYPSHYSLTYYCKGGRPRVFHADRVPLETCRHCFNEIRDYGGYKDKMNPKGVNLSDVWRDIPNVRHKKYKRRIEANELSIKMLDRVIEMSTDPSDLVVDPFGGSGTTYIVAELKKRRWAGCELGPLDAIKERFSKIDEERDILENYRSLTNNLFPANLERERLKRGLWTPETLPKKAKNRVTQYQPVAYQSLLIQEKSPIKPLKKSKVAKKSARS